MDEIVELAYDVDLAIQVEVSDGPRSESPALSECKLAMEIPLEAPPDLAVEETLFALRSARRLLRAVGVPVQLRAKTPSSVPVEASLVSHSPTSVLVRSLGENPVQPDISVRIDPGRPSADAVDGQAKTPLALVRLELLSPIDTNSKELGRTVRRTIRGAKKVLRESGIDLGERLRPSAAAQMADRLRVDGGRLPARGLSELALEEFDSDELPRSGGAENSSMNTARIKSRRHEAKHRLASKGLIRAP